MTARRRSGASGGDGIPAAGRAAQEGRGGPPTKFRGHGGAPASTPPLGKGERGSEGCAPALRADVSKRAEAKPPGLAHRVEPSDPDEDDFGAPPPRDGMAAEAWSLYRRAVSKGDYRSATAAFRTFCELEGALGPARRRKKGSSLAERLKRASDELARIPGVR